MCRSEKLGVIVAAVNLGWLHAGEQIAG